MPVTSYSRTAASNNSAPPNGWPEGQSPGSVNNCGRQMMTDIVNEASKNPAKVLGSVAGTNTITAAMSPALDAYSAGMMVVFTPANTNTGAVTLNIDSLGALDVQKEGGSALVAGDLVAGVPALLVLDAGADDFNLINPQQTVTSGTYTPTLTNTTNISSSTSAVCQYMRVGSVVTVSGRLSVTLTAGSSTASQLQVSLPIASDFASTTQGAGAGRVSVDLVGCSANVISNVMTCDWLATSSGASTLGFTFTYLIV